MQAAMPAERVLMCTRPKRLVLSSRKLPCCCNVQLCGPRRCINLMLPQHLARWVTRGSNPMPEYSPAVLAGA